MIGHRADEIIKTVITLLDYTGKARQTTAVQITKQVCTSRAAGLATAFTAKVTTGLATPVIGTCRWYTRRNIRHEAIGACRFSTPVRPTWNAAK